MSDGKLVGACWILTAVCNLQCPMCYSYLGKGASDLARKRAIVDRLAAAGLRKLMFTGGDPTIDRDLVQIVEYAKLKGLKTALSTNGILLSGAMMEALDPWLDELTLPVDGSCPEIHGRHRGRDGHFHVVMRLLEQVRRHRFQTDVSTVVTSCNREDVIAILDLIAARGIRKWKVFQYDGLMQSEETYRELRISDEQFAEVTAAIEARRSGLAIDFRRSSPEVMRSYVSISPVGEVLLVSRHRYEPVGSILGERSLDEILADRGFSFAAHAARHHRDTPGAQRP